MDEPIFKLESSHLPGPVAAQRFGVTNDYISQLCRKQKVEGVLVGRVWQVKETSLAEYLSAKKEYTKERHEKLSQQLRYEHLVRKSEKPADVFAARAAHFSPALTVVLSAAALCSWAGVAFGAWDALNVPLAVAVQTPISPLVPQMPAPHIPQSVGELQASAIGAVTAPAPQLALVSLTQQAPDFSTAIALANEQMSAANAALFSGYANTGYALLSAGQQFTQGTYALRDISSRSFALAGLIFNKSVYDLGDASTQAVHAELNTASAWDAWTSYLAEVLYPADTNFVLAAAQEAPATQKTRLSLEPSNPGPIFLTRPDDTPKQPTTADVPSEPQVAAIYVTQASLALQLAQLSNSLQSLFASSQSFSQPSFQSAPPVQTFFGNAVPPALPSQLGDADIPDSITVSNYLPLVGGSLTGALDNTYAGTSTFDGNLQVSGVLNALALRTQGRVGISSSTPWGLLSVDAGGASADIPAFVVASSSLANPYFIIDSLGHIGIGTSSANADVTVAQRTNGNTIIAAQRATDVAPSGDFIEYLNAAGDTTLFRVDNSGNIFAGGITNSGALTISSFSQPQFRIQYDPSDEVTTSVTSAGATTYAYNGSAPRASWIPAVNSTTAFQFQNAGGASILSIDSSSNIVTATSLSLTGSTTLRNFTALNATTSQATTTNFAISSIASNSLLKTTTGGAIIPAIAGTDYLTSASGLNSLAAGGITTVGGAITLATSSALSFNGLTLGQSIVDSSGTFTFTPTLSGTLDNSGLTNSSVTINTSGGLSGGGSVSLGGTLNLSTFSYPFSSNATTTQIAFNGGLTASGATTTSIFSATASSTNLFATTASVGTLSAGATTLGAVTSGLINGQTISSAANLTGTLNVASTLSAGTSTITNLAVTNTSTSTIAGGLSVSGNLNFNGALLQNNLPFISSQWTTNGSNIYYSTGNVGIGTTSPFTKLSVQGEGYLSGNLTAANITATGTLAVSGNTTLAGATSTSFAISSIASGNLLKTTTGGAVVAAVAGTDYVAGSSFFSYPFPSNATSTQIAFNGGLTASSLSLGSQLTIANGGTNATSQTTNGITYFDGTKITSGSLLYFDGTNFGVGGAATSRLQVTSTGGANSGINLDLTSASQYATIDFNTPTGLSGQFVSTGASFSNGLIGGDQTVLANELTNGALQLGALGSNGYVTLFTGGLATGNERVRVTSTGNVGIGTTSPSQLLSVAGNGLFSGSVSAANITASGALSVAGNTTLAGATSTSFAISSITSSNLLKTTTGGAIIAAVAGTDYVTPSSLFAFPWTPTIFGATNANATSTLIGFAQGLYALASSTIGNGAQTGGLTISGGATTTGNAYFGGRVGIGTTSPQYALHVFVATSTNPTPTDVATLEVSGPNGTTGAGPALLFKDQAPSSVNYMARIASVYELSGINHVGSLAFYTNPVANAVDNLTERMRISNAGNVGIGTTTPFTRLSVQGNGYFSGDLTAANITATGTLSVAGNTTLAGATSTSFAISSIASGNLLKTTTGGAVVAAVAGTDYVTGAGLSSAYPFQVAGNATSTLTQFNGGLTAYASSTIGSGTQAGGLTINGGATTTGNFLVQGQGFASGQTTFAVYGNISNSVGGAIVLNGGGGGTGGAVSIAAGDGINGGGSSGGNLNLSGGQSSSFAAGGDVVITGGFGGAAGQGGSINLTAGNASQFFGAGGTPGNISFLAGHNTNTNVYGNIVFGSAGGNVGVGTTSPYAKLSIVGGTSGTIVGVDALSGFSGNLIDLKVASTTKLSVNQAGDLLAIGSTTLKNFTGLFATTSQATTTSFAISSIGSGNLLKTTTGGAIIAAVAGTDYITSANLSSAYPFQLSGNATSTLTQFNGGLTAYASSTIGNGTQIGGLTISGGSTTTLNAYFASNVGVGTSSSFAKLSVKAIDTLSTGVTLQTTDSSNRTLFTLFNNGAAQFNTPTTSTSFSNSGLEVVRQGNAGGDYDQIRAIDAGSNGTSWSAYSTTTINSIRPSTQYIYGVKTDVSEVLNHFVAPGAYGIYSTASTGGTDSAGLAVGGYFSAVSTGSGIAYGLLVDKGNVGVGTTSPWANLSIHANNGSTNTTLFAIASSTQSATTTLFSISNTGTTTLGRFGSCNTTQALTTDASGAITCGTISSGASFAWTPTTFGATNANATSTLIGFNAGLYSLASSTIGNGNQNGGLTISGGATTTGNAYFAGNVGIGTASPSEKLELSQALGVSNTLGLLKITDTTNNSNVKIGNLFINGYGTLPGIWFNQATPDGTNYAFMYDGPSNATLFNAPSGAGQMLFRVGNQTKIAISNTGLTTISGGLLSTASTTIGTGAQAGGLTISGGATTTGNLLVQGISTFNGGLTTTGATSTSFAISSIASDNLLKTTTGGAVVAAVAGTDYVTGAGLSSAFPFTPITFGSTNANSTSTLIGFTQGIYALASSTIGNGNQNGGLTISGGATTTGNAYFGGNVGVGTTSLSDLFAISGTTTIAAYTTNWKSASEPSTFMARVGTNAQGNGLLIHGNSTSGASTLLAVYDQFGTLMFNVTNTTVSIGGTNRVALPQGIMTGPAVNPAGVNDYNIFDSSSVSNPAAVIYDQRALSTERTTPLLRFGLGNSIPSVSQSTGGINAVNPNLDTNRGLAFYSYNGSSFVENIRILASSTVGIASSTPFAALSVHAQNGTTNTTLFAIGSSTQTSTSTLFSVDNTGLASTTGLIVSSAGGTLGCATFSATGLLSNTGTACGSGGGGSYDFPLAGNATSTLTQFNGGLTAFASSTIGNGNQNGGLTINGGATTTQNLVVQGTGTSTFSSSLSIGDGSVYASGVNKSFAVGNGTGGLYNINSSGGGSIAFGHVQTTGDGNGAHIIANQDGALAGGYAIESSIASGNITASGQGSVALGRTSGKNITASNTGSFAFGSGVSGGNGDIVSSGLGSVAWGTNITSSNTLSFGFGSSFTNSLANTFMVGFAATPTLTVNSRNLGVGTTSPWAKLAISLNNGDTTTNAFIIASSTASATTTLFSVSNTGNSFLSGTASTTGLIVSSAGGTPGCATFDVLGTISNTHSACGSGGGSYDFPLTGNATSTLTQFNGGLTAFASSTIGNGSQKGGLTISGGATTTGNLFIGGNLMLNSFTVASNHSAAGGNALSGKLITATGIGSFAWGNASISGTGAITASSNGSIALGNGVLTASNSGSIALGYGDASNGGAITSSGAGSFAAGYSTTGDVISSNNGTFAFGSNLVASGSFSMAFGTGFTNNTANTFQVGFAAGAFPTAVPTLTVSGTGLGVGTTSPWAKLAISLNNGDTNTNAFIIASSTQSATTTLFSISNTGSAYFAGNVGIGTTTGSATLNVQAAPNATPFNIASSSGASLLSVDPSGALTAKLKQLTSDYIVDSGSSAISVGDIVQYINGNARKADALTGLSPSVISLPAMPSTTLNASGYMSAAALDSTHFVMVWKDLTGATRARAVIGTISGGVISYGAISTLTSNTAQNYVNVAALDSTHFVVVYADASNLPWIVVSSTFGTNTITPGTAVSVVGATASSMSVAALDSTDFVMNYVNAGTPYAVVASHASTTVMIGIPTSLAAVTANGISVGALDATHFVSGYEDNTNSSNPRAVVSSISGTSTIAVGTPVSVATVAVNASSVSVAVLDATHFVESYPDQSNANRVYAVVSSVSGGTTISPATPTVIVPAVVSSQSLAFIDSSHFALTYTDTSNSTTRPTVVIASVSGTTITPGTPVTLASGASGAVSFTALNSSRFVEAYFQSLAPAAVAGALGSASALGMATNSASAGGTVTVASNGIVSGLSGLTAGSTYYWDEAAGATTSVRTYKIGVALTSSSILLNSGSGAGPDQFFGDAIFANNFRITENASTPQGLIFKNQLGRDIAMIDENGNLNIKGLLSSSNINSTLATSAGTTSISELTTATSTATSTQPLPEWAGVFADTGDTFKSALSEFSDAVVQVMGRALYATVGIFEKLFAKEVHTQKLCVSDDSGETCVTKQQLDTLLAGAGASQSSSQSTPASGGDTTPSDGGNSGSAATSTDPTPTVSDGGDAGTASSTPSIIDAAAGSLGDTSSDTSTTATSTTP